MRRILKFQNCENGRSGGNVEKSFLSAFFGGDVGGFLAANVKKL